MRRVGGAEAPRVPSPDSADGGITIRNWMTCLGLSHSARLVYALIYQFSEDGAGVYNGGLRYAALRCGMSERTARGSVQELIRRGLVREVGHHVNGNHTSGRCLQTLAVPADEARRAWRDRFASVYAGLLVPENVWADSAATPAESATPARSSGEESATPAEFAGVVALSTPAESAAPAKSSGEESATPAEFAGVVALSTPAESAAPAKSSGEESAAPAEFAGVEKELPSGRNAGRCSQISRIEPSPRQKSQGSTEDDGKDNIYNNIYSYPISSSSNPIPKTSPRSEGRVEPWPGWSGMATLTASAVNRHRLTAVEAPYRALLAAGFDAERIQAAWDARQADARSTVSDERYMPNLADWLGDTGATGARAMLHAMIAAERAAAERDASREACELIGVHVPGKGLCYAYKVGGRFMEPLTDGEGLIPVDGGEERARAALEAIMADSAA